MSQNELNPIEILEKLDTFYNNAWEKLIIYNTIFLALIGIIIPFIIQWWQTRNIKIREELLKSEINELFSEKSKELEDKIVKIIEEKFKIESDNIEEDIENIISSLKGSQFHLQANSLSGVARMPSLIWAAENYIKGGDFGNLMTVLLIIKELIPQITKEDVNDILAEKADLESLIEKLDEMENQGAFIRIIIDLKKIIGKIPEKAKVIEK